MIKIRYALLPEGLHAQARWEGRHTVIYLRPGLTSQQRREALRRARQTARMGHGPRLPAASLACALAADRVRATMHNAVAAVRCHPVGAGALGALVAGAMVSYSLFVTVSVHLIDPQVQAMPPNLPRPSAAVPAPHPGASSRGAAAGGTRPGGQTGRGTTGGRTPSPGATGQSSPSARPTPSPSPAAPSPSPSSSSGSGVCVKVGPLGVCLSL